MFFNIPTENSNSKITQLFQPKIKPNSPIKQAPRESKKTPQRISGYIPIEYDIQLKKYTNRKQFQEFLKKKGKVTQKEYENIIKNNPSVLIQAYRYVESYSTTRVTPELIGKAALCLKDSFDRHFGKNKYKIISIGTSPANIAEVIKSQGVDVAFVPASGLNGYCNEEKEDGFIFDIANYTNIKTMLAYLDKQGINDKTQRKENKTNLLIDYCYTGQGLTNMHHFIIERNGISKDKILKIDMGKALYNAVEEAEAEKKPYAITTNQYAEIMGDMVLQVAEDSCSVPHFYIYEGVRSRFELEDPHTVIGDKKDREEIFKEFDNYTTPYARAFSLCTIDVANSYKKNPEETLD